MTNEMKMFIDNTINYMNYCRGKGNEMMNSKDFSQHEYDMCIDRCITLYVTLSDFLEMFNMKVVKDKDGFYSVI